MVITATRSLKSIVGPRPPEREAVAALSDQLEEMSRRPGSAQLVGSDGETLAIPDSVFQALKLVADSMARGESITLVPHDEEITTQEAANMLRVSRPHLVKLLDDGVIPHHKVGSHRRVRTQDVLAYRERRAAHRTAKLDELARISQEVEGGYR